MIPRQLVVAVVILFALAVSMGLYVAELRRRETLQPAPSGEVAHVSPPAAGPEQTLTVWVAYDDRLTLRPQAITVPFSSTRQQRAEDLLRGLLQIYTAKDSPHPIGPAAEVRGLYLVPSGLAVVDLNAAFANEQTSGVMAEQLTVASMIRTLSANFPELTRVKFLIEGKETETLAGHVDLSGIYDVSAVLRLAKELAAQ
jgi:hypothetical protein